MQRAATALAAWDAREQICLDRRPDARDRGGRTIRRRRPSHLEAIAAAIPGAELIVGSRRRPHRQRPATSRRSHTAILSHALLEEAG